MRVCRVAFPAIAALAMVASEAIAQPVVLADRRTVAGIVHEPTRPLTLAAEMLAHDIRSVSGAAPAYQPTSRPARNRASSWERVARGWWLRWRVTAEWILVRSTGNGNATPVYRSRPGVDQGGAIC